MAYWLLKTEPETFSYNDLVSLGHDRWNGVRNFRALKYLRAMRTGDLVFIYHTGKEKAIVGVAEVLTAAYPDPAEKDPRFVVVDVTPRYPLTRVVTLKEVKAQPVFEDWALVRQARLSVMPVTDEQWRLVHEMAETAAI